MITKLRVLVASLVVAGAATAAFAHGGGGKGMRHHGAMLEKFDANKDGKLDDAEKAKAMEARKAMFAQKRAGMLARFDTNKDGTLDDSERAAMRNARIEERFAKLDANKDGAISLDEMKAAKPQGKHGRHKRF
jgi:Ca2+-binding EF-hand superfamily protein